jgi:DNA polymerase-3 subunit epsilon
MSLLGNLFGTKTASAPPVDARVAGRLNNWKGLAEISLSGSLQAQHWLVVDVETTGLDMHRDQLMAIGCVMIEGGEIRLSGSFEIVLQQAAPSRAENILVHRIAGDEQMEGTEPSAALMDFLEYAQKLPCVAFHAAFDETMLKRACRDHLHVSYAPRFIDLALLAPALYPEAPATLRSLDDWVDYFSIRIGARHRAVADALGTAQLFQILLARAGSRGIASAEALFRLTREQRWLSDLSRN